MPKRQTTPIDAIRHDERRANIPTEEQRGFVADQESAPPSLLYPRDPSLDPQLVWRGKDDQDRAGLSVPVVPVYIQEKIHPEAIIEDFVRQARRAAGGQIGEEAAAYQLNLFADFDGFDDDAPGKRLDFYSHDDDSRPHWSNRMILGDSLLVMTSLAEKEGLKGRVQMIYIDPPYGIKFGSNWQVSTRKRDVKDGSADHLTRQPEQVKAFRDTWQLGIHSYLSYLRDRLVAARELLTETGSVLVQMGEQNVHLVRSLMDEVFGSENYCNTILYVTTSTQGAGLLPVVNDHIVWYAKDRMQVKYRQLYDTKVLGQTGSSGYNFVELPDGSSRRLSPDEFLEGVEDGHRYFSIGDLTSSHYSISEPIVVNSKTYTPGHRYWSTSTIGMNRLRDAGRLLVSGNGLRFKRYIDDFQVFPKSNMWTDTGVAGFTSDRKIYVVQTNEKILHRCVLMTTDPGDIVLDPTCGSGTTAYVAEQWGRRWITIDTSRVALALARTRLMSARYPYYHLADDYPNLPLTATDDEIKAHLRQNAPATSRPDIKRGFVYRRVPHITLKSIANNPDIDGIHDAWQPRLDALRAELNTRAGRRWEEWEIPRPDASTKPDLLPLLERWWALRRQRQAEIDAAIARHADTETLFDQPYEDSKRLRVAGPFTVESLSPHRTLPAAAAEGHEPAQAVDASSADFTTMILDYLRRTPIQNTRQNERLKLERLDVFPGRWIQAAGEYTDATGEVRRAAVFIGPEHNAVSPQMIHEAAKEAVRGLGFDVLLVCGFAFDPHANEEAARYPRPVVLNVHMNPDLMMGDELLKKTGAGNLFMIFGEPDIRQETDADGRIVVELLGVDIYDPTTGEVRSSSPDDIACWFIDTDYDEESFFVRHAYFTGAEAPYEKLKKALRADVDEAAWAELYRTRSRPFDRPAGGKIAVKVINHYGDEVLKVFQV